MISNLRRTLARHATNYWGWRSDRKIVVIESDDWGSSCMPSAEIYNKLVDSGVRVDWCPYTRYDALASEHDLQDLFSVLTEFRDKNGDHPVITANAVMMNPDYEKIRDAGFRAYYGKPFTETLKEYPAHGRSFSLWKLGMADNLFYPQFHGREHLNLSKWIASLQKSDSVNRTVFEEGMFWPGSAEEEKGSVSIRAAFDTDDVADLDAHSQIIREGLNQFEDLFGYRSKSFIAPNFVYHPNLNRTLAEMGVEILQGMKYQKLPLAGGEKREMRRRHHGQTNELGQINLVRNCTFEHSQQPATFDSVDDCLKSIQNAFFWKKPAVITAHRLNFIGFIDPGNRERNLKLFRKLLDTMTRRWPDIEFMTSPQLGDLIAESQ
jgi:hypothetical protein